MRRYRTHRRDQIGRHQCQAYSCAEQPGTGEEGSVRLDLESMYRYTHASHVHVVLCNSVSGLDTEGGWPV